MTNIQTYYDNTNNTVKAIGEVADLPEMCGDNAYRIYVKIYRESGTVDILPVVFEDNVIRPDAIGIGDIVSINGAYKSYNRDNTKYTVDDKMTNKLILEIHASNIAIEKVNQDCSDNNLIVLKGNICKQPVYRVTPLGKEITECIIAVNIQTENGLTSDYIPCIFWGSNAKKAAELNVGDFIKIKGRIQSREYTKKISDTETETRTAYEVSVHRMHQLVKNKTEKEVE